jgi:hypothetical protein
MCFIDNSPEQTPAPEQPPEVLKQAAPDKKTATKANTLAIGTKKYRTATGLGPTNTAPMSPPTGIRIS